MGGGDQQRDYFFEGIADHELEEMIKRLKSNIEKLSRSLPDKGEKLRVALMQLEDEKERRRCSRLEKNTSRWEELAQATSCKNRNMGCIKEFKENSRERDFKSFMPLSELYDISAGYLVNDTCIVEAQLNVSIKTGDQGSNVSASVEHSGKELSTVNSVQAADSSPAAKTPCFELQHTPSSEKVCTTPADDGPTDPSLVKELGEVPTNLTGELMEFRGLGQIEKAFVPLLEEVCSLHPSLIDGLHKRNRKVVECAFTALGGLLHFLKTAKVKDMTKDGSARLQSLWEDVQMFTFDLAWLEPHVRSALGMKQHLERARRVKRLREDMDLLGNELKRKRAAIAITEVDLEKTKRDLEKEEEGFVGIDIDSQLGYGTQ